METFAINLNETKRIIKDRDFYHFQKHNNMGQWVDDMNKPWTRQEWLLAKWIQDNELLIEKDFPTLKELKKQQEK